MSQVARLADSKKDLRVLPSHGGNNRNYRLVQCLAEYCGLVNSQDLAFLQARIFRSVQE